MGLQRIAARIGSLRHQALVLFSCDAASAAIFYVGGKVPAIRCIACNNYSDKAHGAVFVPYPDRIFTDVLKRPKIRSGANRCK